MKEAFDYAVIGGGIFGCYAALFLADKGAKVLLLEKEAKLFQKASLVNQARLHSGYHYPRSMATAAMSDEHKARFTTEHAAFVHTHFEKYYAIDRFGSFTDPKQFERFCQQLNIPCERIQEHALFNFDRLDALYLTQEASFDPVLLGGYYSHRVHAHKGIHLYTGTQLREANAQGESWELVYETATQGERRITAPVVINATYAATNAVNALFGITALELTHEISEIAFISSNQFRNKGLTVMDGPFGSIMPYGKSGLLSLSSVAYTHHKISYDALPTFDCQSEHPTCQPASPAICTDCIFRPRSNVQKMLSQMGLYFTEQVHFDYFFSYFTIKSKLKSSYIDDSRPTEISLLKKKPDFYCLFAGKINSIYEVEKII